ncbi:MAG: GGDEF domain-containing protein [Gammaproteobacteria bacterium]
MTLNMRSNVVEETTQTILVEGVLGNEPDERPLSSCLVIISGANIGHQYKIKINQTMIGRSINADIQIDDDSASRDHAFIIRDGDGYRVRDNASKNGCFVNDAKVDDARIKDGDLLRIGKTIFKFMSRNNIEQAYHEELFKLAKVDGLTNVFNRRHFTTSLENEVDRARRYERELSLLMIDIDHFKRVNDSLGHRAGDYVLKQLADIFVNSSRRVDYVCRYGGEEFAIILPEVDIMGANKFAHKLKNAVATHHFAFEQHPLHITISIGVSDAMDSDQSAEDLIETADRRLYLAKERGRNRVISAD